MRIAVDTNVLVRAVVQDNAEQAAKAIKIMREAELIAIPLPCLCELVWVLHRVYQFERADIVAPIRALLAIGNVEVNRPAVEAGLAILEKGGDFADGVIAYEGRWLGASTFVSFDKKAAALLKAQGQAVHLL